VNSESGSAMSTASPPSGSDNAPAAVVKLKERFADPSVQESLKGFNKTMQFSFTDLKEDYVFTVADGKLANVEKKNLPNANIVITVANSLMEGIMNKTSNPMTAYMTGKLKVKGPMDDLMRLQKLMG
jgi:putative sterol carrier protein